MPTPIGGLSPGDALERSYRGSIVEPVNEKAEHVLEVLGARIATVGVGLSDARQLRSWARGESRPRGDSEDRLRILFRITLAVSSVFGPDTAAGFVRGANPSLNDKSVLNILANESPTPETEKRLMGVVRDFLEG